jgi:purine-nucleoside phosphorylase
MLHLADQIAEATAKVRQQWRETPTAGVILGSGLGDLAKEIDGEATIDYADLPHFPHTTAVGHAGKLVCGTLAGKPVVAFQGRFHLYDGHTAETASLPVRLLKALGGKVLIVSNAAGGLNPLYGAGDIMLIDDHSNLMFANPLIGVNDESLGPRYPDMSRPYDPLLQACAGSIALEQQISLRSGTYVAVLGPNYETRAEYRMLRRLGGDAVGMSTVPEVIAARHADLRVLGLSTITNVSSPDAPTATSAHDVLDAAANAAYKVSAIVRGVLEAL